MTTRKKERRPLPQLIVSFLIIAAATLPATAAPEPVTVCVSIAPQKYFVEKIGKKRVAVSVMVAPGANPANYEPKPRQMVAISKTMLYFAAGVPFEDAWLNKIAAANPKMQIVPTQKGIAKIGMQAHIHPSGDPSAALRDSSAEHAALAHPDGIKDPHIWLSPPLVMLQARAMLQALAAVDPLHRSVYEANYKRFINEIVDLDAELRAVFADPSGGRQFMVFHPAWGYFASAYGLQQIAVEMEGKNPKPSDLKYLIEYARKLKIRVIFVQPQFSTKSAEVIASAIGGRIVAADPLAADWAQNLRRTGAKFKPVLK